MGWFFNKDSNNNSQFNQSEQNPNSSNFFQTKSSYYSKKRHCENDPEDNQFIICKTIIKDNNGTREEEERIPKNAYNNNGINQNESFSFSSSFKDPFRNGREDDQRAFDKFNSFFIQPSFFDLHNSSLPRVPQGQQVQSYSSSYSQSKTCQTDPQDHEYLICKSKVYDGKETKQVEQRVKVSDQFMIPSFRGEFDNFGNEIDKQIHNMMRDINKGFNFIMPFIGPFMGFINELQNLDQQGISSNGYPKGYKNNMRKFDQEEQRPDYINSNNKNKKDTNVYDL